MIIKSIRQGTRFAVLTGALMLSACSATFQNHGYVPEQDALDELVVGVDTRGSLEDIVGPPSSTGVMDDEGWFYISSKIRHYAYLRPQVVEREMVAVIGDSANMGSIALHRALGFREVGVLQDVGRKHGRWLDSVLMQRRLHDETDIQTG